MRISICIDQRKDRSKAKEDKNELLNFEEELCLVDKFEVYHSSDIIEVLNIISKLIDNSGEKSSLFILSER